MNYDILFLNSNKKESTKGAIIRALAAHNMLTNTQIQKVLKKEHNKKISYQAIRQALTELKDKNILTKENNSKFYSINPTWVLELKDITHTLEKSIIKEQTKTINKETTQITLKNLAELGHFVLFGLEHKYFNPQDKSNLYIQFNHLWIPFAHVERRNHLIRLFKRTNPYVIIKENSLGDKMLKKWYQKYCKVKLDTDITTPCEYLVQGDCVVQIYMPKKLIEKMNKVYGFKNIIKLNFFKEISEMTYENHNIEIIITRNNAIAKKIKENITAHF